MNPQNATSIRRHALKTLANNDQQKAAVDGYLERGSITQDEHAKIMRALNRIERRTLHVLDNWT